MTKDSGDRREYSTGSVRDRQEGKGRFDLVPLEAIRRLAKLYERGAVKYGDSNWKRGQPLMASYFDSAMRHLCDLAAGEPEEDHCAAVLWNVCGYMWTLAEIEAGRLPQELDDRPAPAPQYVGRSGSTFDEWLDEEGFREDVDRLAKEKIAADAAAINERIKAKIRRWPASKRKRKSK